MTLIKIQALSVNKCWQGRRFKTEDYEDYELELFYLLPKTLQIPKGKIKLEIIFGFSSRGQDIDSSLKPTIDILQKRYLFNDNRIYKLEVEKVIVKKGSEYISLRLKKL